MAEMHKGTWQYRIPAGIPKPEYVLLKSMAERYALTEREMIVAALRLAWEVCQYDEPRGEQWFIQVVNTIRSKNEENRLLDDGMYGNP